MLTALVALLPDGACAKEVLPPIAYVNRTIYPALTDYRSSPRGYPLLAIGLLSDVQYAEREEVGRRHFKLSFGKLQHAVREFNANRSHLDMVIHLGDLVDSDMSTYLPKLQPVLDELKYPLYNVLGNHDFLGSPESAFDTIYKQLKMPARYYSLNAGPDKRFRLIMLDGNDLALYSTKAGSVQRKEAEEILATLKRRRARNAKPFNGAVGAAQLEWMKGQLQEACDAGQQAFLFIHHPMRPKDEPTNLWNDIAIVPIITSYHCAAAVINGHAHKFLYDYHYTKHRHVHFVTFGGMVQSPFTTFGFADVYSDCLHVHGLIFGREIDLHYNLSYHAPPGSPSARPPTLPAPRPTVASAPTDGGDVAATVAAAKGVVSEGTSSVEARTAALREPATGSGGDGGDVLAGSRRVAMSLSLLTVLLVAATVVRVCNRRAMK